MQSLRIVGKTYRVDRSESPQGLGGMQFYGTCDHARSIITLDSAQDAQQERDTLLHEALHAIDFSLAIGLKERQVHALGAGLLALFVDNPGFASWLSGYEAEEPAKAPAKKSRNATRTR